MITSTVNYREKQNRIQLTKDMDLDITSLEFAFLSFI